MALKRSIGLVAAALFGLAGAVCAQTAGAPAAGEMHRMIVDPTAIVRVPTGGPRERLTLWYPAAAGAQERPVIIGPSDAPNFDGGSAAPDAAWRDPDVRYPLVLMSHGFGGTARQMAWLGTVLARHGFVVAAVDHPGTNGMEPITLAGATLWWLRAEDLRAALAAVEADPALARHVDVNRLGVAGFSIGGYTALVLAGARPDPSRYRRHCRAAPEDGVCQPQKEMPELDPRKPPVAALAIWRDHPPLPSTSPGRPALPISALFLMAPAVISGLDPDSLRAIDIPTVIVLGDADAVATPKYNGLELGRLMPQAKIDEIAGVDHYDFLDSCTSAGAAAAKGYCRSSGDTRQAMAHTVATQGALALFDKTLRSRRAGAMP